MHHKSDYTTITTSEIMHKRKEPFITEMENYVMLS